MQIVIIAAFLVVLAVPVGEFRAGTAWTAGALLAYLAITAAIGAASTIASLRDLRRDRSNEDYVVASRPQRWHERLAMLQQFWLVAGLAGLVYIGVGDNLAQKAAACRIPLGGEAILLWPFVLATLLGWLADYPAYRAMRSRLARSATDGQAHGQDARATVLSLREFLSYNLRHNFLFVAVPLGVIYLLRDCLYFFAAPAIERVWPQAVDTAVWVGSIAIAIGVMILVLFRYLPHDIRRHEESLVATA